MQYLLINKSDTLLSISKIVGQSNIDLLLSENGLSRVPRIGEQWYDKCDTLIRNTPNNVTGARKAALLNNLTGSEEVFEKACLMDEDEWKVFSAFQAFTDALRVPEAIKLPSSAKVIGDTLGDVQATIGNAGRKTTGSQVKTNAEVGTSKASDPVNPVAYRKVMKGLKESPDISPAVFNSVNTSPPVSMNAKKINIENRTPQYAYSLPWGKIQMYSSLLDEVAEFPAYPEEVETSRTAKYTSMPDIIYQYEPWIVYESSGPREQSLTFHLHRDMWSGNHLDGRANDLIRFCECNTFPKYTGSAVLAPRVRFYIDGSLFISGVLTQTTVRWSGPIGQDNWYLDFELSLMIQEVAEQPLNIKTVRQLGLIGS